MRGHAARRVETEALVVRSVEYGEADAVVTLFTRAEGKVSAMVRGARKSTKRLGGALDPMHTIEVVYADRGSELVTLEQARICRLRAGLTAHLDALEAAGQALRWLRHLCAPRTPEPDAWADVAALLDALDGGAAPSPALARFGLRLVAGAGWGIDFGQCVRCGKPCPPDRPAAFDAGRGGLVCQACGGATRLVAAPVRALAKGALARESPATGPAGRPDQWQELLDLVGDVMVAHTGYKD